MCISAGVQEWHFSVFFENLQIDRGSLTCLTPAAHCYHCQQSEKGCVVVNWLSVEAIKSPSSPITDSCWHHWVKPEPFYSLASSSSSLLWGLDQDQDDFNSVDDDDEAREVWWGRISEAAASGNVIKLHLLQTENFAFHHHHRHH